MEKLLFSEFFSNADPVQATTKNADLGGPDSQPFLLLLTCILGIRDEFLEAVFVLFNVLLLLSLNGCSFGVPVRKKTILEIIPVNKPQ